VPYMAPNGKKYKSKRAYERSIKAMFAQMARSGKFRRSKRLNKKIIEHSKSIQKKRRQKPFTETPVIKRGPISHEVAGYTKEKERKHSATFINEQGARVYVVESEEAGKYTPKRTVTQMEYLEDADVLGITKKNPRTDKVVSSTLVKIDSPKPYILEARFKAGENLTMAELRVLAQDKDVRSAGITKLTLEKRLRRKLGITKTKAKKDKQRPQIRTAILASYDKNNTRFTGGVVKVDKIYKELKQQGYSDTEIRRGLRGLEKARHVELQIASDDKVLSPETKEDLKKLGLWRTKPRGTLAYIIKRETPPKKKDTHEPKEEKKRPEVKVLKAKKPTKRQLELIEKATSKQKKQPKKIDVKKEIINLSWLSRSTDDIEKKYPRLEKAIQFTIRDLVMDDLEKIDKEKTRETRLVRYPKPSKFKKEKAIGQAIELIQKLDTNSEEKARKIKILKTWLEVEQKQKKKK